MDSRLRSFLAPNASPMTLDGTITYVVGRETIAIIDPGSASSAHLERLASAVAGATRTVIIVTHAHPDHSEGALELADRIGAVLLGGHAGRTEAHDRDTPADIRRAARAVKAGEGQVARAAGGGLLADGVSIDTDAGELIVLRTPGHSPDHISLHWPAGSAIFCGDLMMGGLDTAVVAAPEGDLGAYLESLERMRQLAPKVIYPSHGPPFTKPAEAIDRYIAHRHARLDQVREALGSGADDVKSLTDHVYGDSIDPSLRPFAESAVEAYLAYLKAQGQA